MEAIGKELGKFSDVTLTNLALWSVDRKDWRYGDLPYDVVAIFGDRAPALHAALDAHIQGIPVVHIHAGERTLGSSDDDYRDAISCLSSYLFCSHERYADRLRQAGFRNEFIEVVGAPSLCLLDGKERKLDPNEPYCVATLHTATKSPESPYPLLDALHSYRGRVVFTTPAPDPGFDELKKAIWGRGHYFTNFTSACDFIDKLCGAQFFIGNSSVSFFECPVLRVPAINVGRRQAGRLTPLGTINVRNEESAIRKAMEGVPSIREFYSPYHRPDAARRIAQVLAHGNIAHGSEVRK